MNIRGIVTQKLGSRIFVVSSLCTCNQCPSIDLTQAQLRTDIDNVNVGDKVESYSGNLWYKVDQYTPNAEYDDVEDLDDVEYGDWGLPSEAVSRRLN